MVDATKFRSKSSNTPFAGWRLQGRADTVIVAGRIKYRDAVETGETESRRPVRAR
jgi:dihydroorotase-like cyclic amidohydrolase